jgi:hypothetical protein
MSVKNKKIVERIIKVFGDKNYNIYLNYLDDDIKWNIIGMPAIVGKSEFINAINSLEIENFTSSQIKNIISEGEFVVVESTGRVISENVNQDAPAYCDIYRIINSKLCELTTYIIDTTSNNEN